MSNNKYYNICAMNQSSFLKKILREIFRQNINQSSFSLNVEISDSLIEQAIYKIIKMKNQLIEGKAIMDFLKSNKNVSQLKIDYGLLETNQKTRIIKDIYELKSVVISWNNCFKYLLQNKTIEKRNFLSILSNMLKMGENQNYKEQSKILLQRYYNPFIESIKNSSCQQCAATFISLNEDKDEIIKINEDFARQLQAKTKECIANKQLLQKYKEKIQFLQQRVKKLDQISKKNNQSVIFTQQFPQFQYDKIDKQISQQFQLPLQQIQKRPLSIYTEFQYKLLPILRKQLLLVRQFQISLRQIKKISQKATETINIQFSQNSTQVDQHFVDTIQTQTDIIETKSSETQTEAFSFEQIFRDKLLMLNENTRKEKLFSGQVFGQQDTYRVRLVDQIQSKGKYRIKSTHLLYRYDPLNKQNFHRYIDNVQGLAFVVKTLKGVYLCGYYSGKLVPNQILNQFGLIINLNKDQSYEIKQEPHSNRVIKAMIYDDFYCIFGNAELRIKSWENHIFSNFGIMGAYFNNKGKKIQDFLGEENERQAFFYTYQFFQVKLDDQSKN